MIVPRRTLAWAAACSLITLALGAPLVKIVGLGQGEVYHAVVTVPMLGSNLAKPLSHYPFMPLMKDSYQGSFKIFLLYVPFKLFGAGTSPLRWTTLAIASLIPFFVVLLAARLYGLYLGALLGVLVAADHALILIGCFDTGPAVLMLLWKLSGLWLLAEWWLGRGKPLLLFGAGWVFGMALWDKSHFLWVLAALPVCAVLLPWRKWRERLTAANVAAGLGGFLLGAAPYLIHNLMNPLVSIKDPGHLGWDLMVHLPRLTYWIAERGNILIDTLSGSGQYSVAGVERNGPILFTFVATLALTLILAPFGLLRRRGGTLRHAAFWLALSGLIFLAACLSPVPVKWHHLYTIYPLPYIAMTAMIAHVLAHYPALVSRRNWWVVPFFAACVFSQLWVLRDFRRDALRTGGGIQFERAMEDVARWASQRHAEEPDTRLFFDAGFENRLSVLTRGGLPMTSFDIGHPDGRVSQNQLETVPEILKWPGSIVIARLPLDHPVEFSVLPALRFLRIDLEPLRIFTFWDGRPWASAYRLRSPMMTSFLEAAELLRRGRKAQAAARIKAGLGHWRRIKARQANLQVQGSGLSPESRAPTLMFFLLETLQSLTPQQSSDFIKEVRREKEHRPDAEALTAALPPRRVDPPANGNALAASRNTLAAGWIAKAETAIRSGRAEDALAALSEARRLEQTGQMRRIAGLYQRLNRETVAFELISALAARPEADADIWLERAGLAVTLGHREAALKSLSEAGARKPTPQQRRKIAFFYQKLAQYPQAIELLSRLIQENPRDAGALSDKGLCEYLNGSPEAALTDLSRALAIDPNWLPAYLSLGYIHTASGRRDEADRLYEKAAAIKTTPENKIMKDLIQLERR